MSCVEPDAIDASLPGMKTSRLPGMKNLRLGGNTQGTRPCEPSDTERRRAMNGCSKVSCDGWDAEELHIISELPGLGFTRHLGIAGDFCLYCKFEFDVRLPSLAGKI